MAVRLDLIVRGAGVQAGRRSGDGSGGVKKIFLKGFIDNDLEP
jgi:hypothetical protein